MSVKLSIDLVGQPIIELDVKEDSDVEGKLLRRFIEVAKSNGVTVEDDCGEQGCDEHAIIGLRILPKKDS